MPQKDNYGRHEVMHMSSFLMEAVDRELMEHEQIKANPEWSKLANKAHQALFDLYQAIGEKHLDAGEETSKS